jgi:formylglycine-generating enzyme required for sulfatase activity
MNNSTIASAATWTLWPMLGRITVAALIAGLFMLASCTSTPSPPVQAAGGQVLQPEQYEQTIPNTTVAFRMLPVPGDGADIDAFYLCATEVTWDMYDLFVYGETSVAGGSEKGADAVTRPSKPYLPPDRGFAHAGYAALSMSHFAATMFCDWLSQKTGRRYRLPTEEEWAHACALNAAQLTTLADAVWFGDNADDKTHPVGSKAAGAIGLHDMAGNASEWVTTAEGKPTTCGGSYKDDAEDVGCAARRPPSSAWNASDPQLPKSQWWLADCPFVGFRVACDIQGAGKAGE